MPLYVVYASLIAVTHEMMQEEPKLQLLPEINQQREIFGRRRGRSLVLK